MGYAGSNPALRTNTELDRFLRASSCAAQSAAHQKVGQFSESQILMCVFTVWLELILSEKQGTFFFGVRRGSARRWRG